MFENAVQRDKDNFFRQRNSLLNFFKGIGCIGVVFIHFMFPGTTGAVISKLSQYSVPIFLMISGYFAFSLKGEACLKIKRRAKRILKITIYTVLFYVIYTLFFQIKNHSVVDWIYQFTNWKIWIRVILLSDFDVINAGHLWFLPSLIYSYIILYFIDKYNLCKLVYKCLPLLMSLRVIVSVIVQSFSLTWHLRGNFLIGAMPWLIFGNYVAYSKKFKEHWNNRKLIVGVITGAAFAVIFVVFDAKIDLSEIGIIVYASSLFLLAVNNPSKSINTKIERLGDKYSLYVYIIHIAIGGIIDVGIKLIGLEDDWYLWSKPIIVACISILGSMIIYFGINIIKNTGNIKENFKGVVK